MGSAKAMTGSSERCPSLGARDRAWRRRNQDLVHPRLPLSFFILSRVSLKAV